MAYDYKEPLEAARTELEALLNEETGLEYRLIENRKRTEALRETVLTLAVLVGEEQEEESVGITDAIRTVLKNMSDRSFQPRVVRLHLKRADFPLDKYKNPLAVIHTTLKRLEQQGEVKTVEIVGKTYYVWNESATTDDDIPF